MQIGMKKDNEHKSPSEKGRNCSNPQLFLVSVETPNDLMKTEGGMYVSVLNNLRGTRKDAFRTMLDVSRYKLFSRWHVIEKSESYPFPRPLLSLNNWRIARFSLGKELIHSHHLLGFHLYYSTKKKEMLGNEHRSKFAYIYLLVVHRMTAVCILL